MTYSAIIALRIMTLSAPNWQVPTPCELVQHQLKRAPFGSWGATNIYTHISCEISMSGKKGGNKLRTYKLFKNSLAFEPYLKIANPEKRIIIAQFRTSAHRLHIKTGRFGHDNTYVPPPPDEFHFLIECPKYLPLRTELFSSAGELNKYFDRYSPELKFVWIMSNENENVINLIYALRMRNHLIQSWWTPAALVSHIFILGCRC